VSQADVAGAAAGPAPAPPGGTWPGRWR